MIIMKRHLEMLSNNFKNFMFFNSSMSKQIEMKQIKYKYVI